MLRKLKRSGRKVFLLTNSLWNYTDVVMNYLYEEEPSGQWIDLFDVIITGSAKPAFLLNPRLPLFRCDPKDGTLSNTEGVYGETAEQYLSRGKCFQGGNFTHLHDMLNILNGTQLLYVGDHIYSDVLRTKRTLGWRTMLIVPELEHEINTMYDRRTRALRAELEEMRDKRNDLDEWVDRLEGELVSGHSLSPAKTADIQQELSVARRELEISHDDIARLVDEYHGTFHPIWGQLFKTGMQNSRFAEQVEDYACLYTSRVTNIGLVSPEMSWREMNDLMPHDRLADSPMHRVLSRRSAPHSPVL
ncbi:cytosolic IMP-GMP specific 5'-nucleotidase [Gracilaria domingensis]|nr:cytosolic IMP-GMP specific 5'-nucleotidase [Gracilaria domingensis]